MPKPRRTTSEYFYDQFADFPLADQAAALRILNELHRQKQREEKRKPGQVARVEELDGLMHRQQNMADATDPRRNAALLIEEEGGPKQ